MYPADPEGEPSEVYNCRCKVVAYFPNISKDRGTGKSVESYEKWLNDRDNKAVLLQLKQQTAIHKASKYTETITANTNDGYKVSGIKQGKQMSIEKADKGNANPLYVLKNDEYTRNCQRCVWAYELRRRGYDVIASEKILNGDTLSIMTNKNGWANVAKNGINQLERMDSSTGNGCKKNIEAYMKTCGDGTRAIVRVRWQNYQSGHVFIAEQVGDTTRFIDPQSGDTDVSGYFGKGMIKPSQTYLLRIDDKELTPLISKCAKGKKNDKY